MSFVWQNRRVLVTGATGLLGSWLVKELLNRQATVTCLVRDWTPRSDFVRSQLTERVNVVRGAIEDFELVLRAVNEYEVQTVIHLAAQTVVGTASRSVLSTFEANIKGTWNVLEACRATGTLVEEIVLASSDKAYGDHERLPYSEDAPLNGRYPYDASKVCSEVLAFSYAKSYGLPVATTRCGNLFGGGDLNFSRLVPGTIQSALLGERPIVRSDGKFVRDYFYVEDAVDAYLCLAEQIRALDLGGEAFNFGAEAPKDVLEMVDLILGAVGRPDLEPVILNQASHEILEQYLDCSKARSVLSWEPTYSMEEGLARTVEWYRENADETRSAEAPG